MGENLNFAELKASGKLPSPKGVAMRVMLLCQEESVSLPELARAIQGDPALSGRIIKVANYVNPNKVRPIASVTTETLILIGIQAVRQAVMHMSLISNYREGPCKLFDYGQLWSRSVAMASAARAISAATNIAPQAEMFNCGLMSGIGQLALVTARPDAYCEIIGRLQGASPEMLLKAQREHFGIDANDMMVLMLQDWGIPRIFQDALLNYSAPLNSGFPEDSRLLRLTLTLQLASLLADACLHEEIDDALAAEILNCGSLLELQPEQLQTFFDQTVDEWRDWCTILDIRANDYPHRKLMQEPGHASKAHSHAADHAAQAAIPLKIVVVSTDEARRAQLIDFLVSSGHSVMTTDSGLTAFGMATQHYPQVVIADLLLPGMDGNGLCTELRRAFASKPLYFILMTPFGDEHHKMEAYESGVDEMLTTPLNSRLLAARLLAAQRIVGQTD